MQCRSSLTDDLNQISNGAILSARPNQKRIDGIKKAHFSYSVTMKVTVVAAAEQYDKATTPKAAEQKDGRGNANASHHGKAFQNPCTTANKQVKMRIQEQIWRQVSWQMRIWSKYQAVLEQKKSTSYPSKKIKTKTINK